MQTATAVTYTKEEIERLRKKEIEDLTEEEKAKLKGYVMDQYARITVLAALKEYIEEENLQGTWLDDRYHQMLKMW